jgi:copper chaperone CopZ
MIKTTLIIDGMSCGMCESHINDVIRSKFDVKKVKSSHKRGETEIISEDVLNHDDLKAAIQETGYEVLSVENEPYKKKGFFG